MYDCNSKHELGSNIENVDYVYMYITEEFDDFWFSDINHISNSSWNLKYRYTNMDYISIDTIGNYKYFNVDGWSHGQTSIKETSEKALSKTETQPDENKAYLIFPMNQPIAIENSKKEALMLTEDDGYQGDMTVYSVQILSGDKGMYILEVDNSDEFAFYGFEGKVDVALASNAEYREVESEGSERIVLSEANGISIEGGKYTCSGFISSSYGNNGFVAISGDMEGKTVISKQSDQRIYVNANSENDMHIQMIASNSYYEEMVSKEHSEFYVNDPQDNDNPIEYDDETEDQIVACPVFGFCTINGKKYQYEDGIQQGVYGDLKNVRDVQFGEIERGREIYDLETDAWYWLDAIYDGAAAYGKEVWMPYVYQDEKKWDDAEIRMNADSADEGMKDFCYKCMKEGTGKWVRYDENGAMLKGWVEIKGELAKLYPDQKGNTYYYDHFTGLMAKGWLTIDGELHHFDEISGVMMEQFFWSGSQVPLCFLVLQIAR